VLLREVDTCFTVFIYVIIVRRDFEHVSKKQKKKIENMLPSDGGYTMEYI
jgi:hypothetical protein